MTINWESETKNQVQFLTLIVSKRMFHLWRWKIPEQGKLLIDSKRSAEQITRKQTDQPDAQRKFQRTDLSKDNFSVGLDSI